MPEHILDNQLTVMEAARAANYSRETIYRALQANKIKHVKRKIGRLVFYLIDRESLMEYRAKYGREEKDGVTS